MTSPLATAPVLAHVERSGLVESVHHGVVAAVGPDGKDRIARGPVDAPIFPRSSNKPLQAVAMLRHGLTLPPEQLALACASHNGEPYHLEGVRRMLAAAGLTEGDLQNTPDRPIYAPERERWIAQGRAPSSLGQNCSGKHAAMLATCVVAGWDTAGYRSPEHPLQRAIRDTVVELTGDPITVTGTDGCGAPLHAVSTRGLARAFGALAAAPDGTPEHTVAAAMRAHPDYLSGTGRDLAALVRGIPGLVGKDGAEAVFAVGLPDGTGLAVKITDGGSRARTPVTVAALRRLGVTAPVLEELATVAVLGHGHPVGRVAAVGI